LDFGFSILDFEGFGGIWFSIQNRKSKIAYYVAIQVPDPEIVSPPPTLASLK